MLRHRGLMPPGDSDRWREGGERKKSGERERLCTTEREKGEGRVKKKERREKEKREERERKRRERERERCDSDG